MPDADDHPPRLLITAGPTHEPIDAVRYLANRSSGRMGLALARAAVRLGLPTTLLLGPTPRQPPESTLLTVGRFQTTADLAAELARRWPEHDVLLMAAAVADYRPVTTHPGAKLPRGAGGLTLELEPTPDLLAALEASTRPDQTRIAFALEPPERLEAGAREKLARKGVEAIVANPLATMGSERVTACVHLRDGRRLRPPADLDKDDFAEWLLGQLPVVRGVAAT